MPFDDIIFGLGGEDADPEKTHRKIVTSDKLKGSAKCFLEKNFIRESNFSEKAFGILCDVIDNFTLPKKGVQLRIRTQQQINLISLVLKMVDVHGLIDELTITTYTFNRPSLSTISDLVKSYRIKKLNLLIASSYSFRDNKYYQYIKDVIIALKNAGHDVHLIFAWSHFKITLAKCGDDYYQFEGSMNYSTNNMAENLLFENSKETYYFDYDFINRIMTVRDTKALEIVC